MAARLPFAKGTHLRLVVPDERGDRPITRGDCDDAPRPCPWIECRYHNARVETDNRSGEPGRLRGLHIPTLNDAERSCALDIAERGGVTLDEIADVLGMTREGARLAEERALDHLRALLEALETEP